MTGFVQQAQTITETAGNFLIAVVMTKATTLNPVTVADALGNTWIPAAPAQSQLGWSSTFYSTVQIFYAPNVLGGANTVYASQLTSYDSNSQTGLYLLEYSGVASSYPVDVSAGQPAGSSTSTASTGNMTLTTSCTDLVVAGFINDQESSQGSIGFSAGTGWSQRGLDTTAASLVEDNSSSLGSAGAGVNAQASLSASDGTWAATQVAFQAQGSATPTLPAQLAITSAPQTLPHTWTCSSAVTVQAQDSTGSAVELAYPLPIQLSGSGLAFFSDSGCTVPITETAVLQGSSTQTFYVEGATTGAQTLTAAASGVGTAGTQNETITALVPYTWIGGAGCGAQTWTTAACWSGGSAPANTSIVHFDTNCSSNCAATLTGNKTVGAVFMHPAPAAAISLSLGTHNLTIGSGDLNLAGGTFNGGSGTLSVSGNLIIQKGGTVNLSSGTNSISTDVAFYGGTIALNGLLSVVGNYSNLGASVVATGSNLQFADSNCTSAVTFAIIPGSTAYNNVTFADGNYHWCVVTRAFGPGSTMAASGTVTFNGQNQGAQSLLNGTIAATGGVVVQNYGYAGSMSALGATPTLLQISGSTNQLIDASSTVNGSIPSLTIASTGGTVTFKGAPQIFGNYAYVSGTVDFTSNNATLAFNYDNGACPPSNGFIWTIVPGNIAYNNVSFQDNSDNWCQITRSLANGSTMTVNGTLTLNGNTANGATGAGLLVNGQITALGNVTILNNGYAAPPGMTPTVIEIAGSTSQLVDASSTTTAAIPSLTIASTGGTVTFNGTLLVFGNYAYVSGTVDFTTNNATLAFSYGPSNNSYVTCFSPYWALNWTITPGNITYNNVTFNDTTAGGFCTVTRTLAAGSTMTVNGTLTLNGQGTTQSLMAGTIAASGDIVVQNDGYNGTTALDFIGGANTTLSIAGGASVIGGDWTVSKSAQTATVTFPAAALSASGQSLWIAEGTVDMGGTLSIAGDLTLDAGTTLNKSGDTLTVTGSTTDNGTINP